MKVVNNLQVVYKAIVMVAMLIIFFNVLYVFMGFAINVFCSLYIPKR
jgi:hypothetical protein